MMIRLNELVEEGLGCLVERTQQQTIFYKEIPNPDIEDSLKNHGVELEDYRSKFFEVDYKCSERQRHVIKMANPERRLIDRLFLGLLEADGENERFSEDPKTKIKETASNRRTKTKEKANRKTKTKETAANQKTKKKENQTTKTKETAANKKTKTKEKANWKTKTKEKTKEKTIQIKSYITRKLRFSKYPSIEKNFYINNMTFFLSFSMSLFVARFCGRF
jgi:cobalamin biosynthesis Mg chelatase CobN